MFYIYHNEHNVDTGGLPPSQVIGIRVRGLVHGSSILEIEQEGSRRSVLSEEQANDRGRQLAQTARSGD